MGQEKAVAFLQTAMEIAQTQMIAVYEKKAGRKDLSDPGSIQ